MDPAKSVPKQRWSSAPSSTEASFEQRASVAEAPRQRPGGSARGAPVQRPSSARPSIQASRHPSSARAAPGQH
eukprot:3930686-Lingulodinium_polyedra.AAC.1